jgi:hypothetical protein
MNTKRVGLPYENLKTITGLKRATETETVFLLKIKILPRG